MRVKALFLDNDMVLQFAGLTDENGDYVNDAVITADLVDEAGVQVTGQTWPLTLAYVAASDGIYQGILEDTLVLTDRAIYKARITIVAGGANGYWEEPCLAQVRTGA